MAKVICVGEQAERLADAILLNRRKRKNPALTGKKRVDMVAEEQRLMAALGRIVATRLVNSVERHG